MNKIKVGVSECLLGINCRFDGGHKKDEFLTQKLSKYVEFIPFCPEDSILGHPRESIRLVKTDMGIRAIGNETQKDYTQAIKDEAKKAIEVCKKEGICGYIFKSKSPSCGIGRLKVYLPNGVNESNDGVGIFASQIIDSFFLLPIEDEGRLQDPWLRENFIMQLFAYHDLQNFLKSATKHANLVEFHTRYKFLLLSKSNQHYQKLGQIVANKQKAQLKDVLSSYKIIFLETIAKKSSAKRVFNVLEHMYGFLKEKLTKAEKEEFLNTFLEFKNGIVPLIAPIKLLRLYANKYEENYLKNQVFLYPYPDDLALRSELKAFK